MSRDYVYVCVCSQRTLKTAFLLRWRYLLDVQCFKHNVSKLCPGWVSPWSIISVGPPRMFKLVVTSRSDCLFILCEVGNWSKFHFWLNRRPSWYFRKSQQLLPCVFYSFRVSPTGLIIKPKLKTTQNKGTQLVGGSSKPTLRAHQKVDLSGSISPVPGQDSNREAGLFEKELRSKSRGLWVSRCLESSLRLFRLGGWREGQHAPQVRGLRGQVVSHSHPKTGLQTAKTLTQFSPYCGWR